MSMDGLEPKSLLVSVSPFDDPGARRILMSTLLFPDQMYPSTNRMG